MDDRHKSSDELIAELVELREQVSHLSEEVNTRRHIEQVLQYRIAFNDLVTSISSRFINLPLEAIDEGIQTALHMIGDFAGVDRSYVILLSEDGTVINTTHEWCSEGIPPQLKHLEGRPSDFTPFWYNELRQFKKVKVFQIDQMPEEALVERTLMRDQGLQSVILVPMKYRQKLVGYVGYDAVHEPKMWSEDSIALLDIIAEIFVNALSRKRTEESLRLSQVRYEMAVAAGKVGIWRWELKSDKVEIDTNIETMLGYEAAEFDNSVASLMMYVYPEDYSALQTAFEELENNAVAELSIVHRLYHKDGSVRWFMTRGVLHTEDAESGPVILGTSTDITDRKEIEATAEQKGQVAIALHDSIAALLGTLDRDEILDRILTNLSRVIPHDSANVMLIEGDTATVVRQHRSNTRLQYRHNAKRILNLPDMPLLQEMRKTGQAQLIADVRSIDGWQKIPGTEWIHSYLGVPIRVADEVIGFLNVDSIQPGFFSDAHLEMLETFASQAALAIRNSNMYREMEARVRERTAALQTTHDNLKEASEIRDTFVANVSHELRTPLTNLKLYHHLLESKPDKWKHYLRILQRETNRLERIVEDLLQFSRLEHAEIVPEIGSVDLNELCLQFVEDRGALAHHQGITLIFNEGVELPLVQADRYLLGQVLSILLTNALNFSPVGSQVALSTHHRREDSGGQWAGFSVADSGPGIPTDEQPYLFERFFRGKAAMDTGMPGTGLGLSIAREIVLRHEGKIEVESSGVEGEGARFIVWLPA